MKKVILILILATFIMGCKEKTDFYKTAELADSLTDEVHPGKKLMETNCYLCHGPKANQGERIGPPMIAVKKHYINTSTKKEDFIKEVQAWIKNPNESNAKMPGAVRRFGIMPKQQFPEETIEKIADYIYDNDIEEPEWFEGHMKKEHGTKKSN